MAMRVREVATKLRNMITERRQTAKKPLESIFNHFDRRNTGSFDALDLAGALGDLNLPCDASIAKALIKELAINSSRRDRVTFGELRVFVDDDGMAMLWESFCSSMGKGSVRLWMEFSGYNNMQLRREVMGGVEGEVGEIVGSGDISGVWGGRREVNWKGEIRRGAKDGRNKGREETSDDLILLQRKN